MRCPYIYIYITYILVSYLCVALLTTAPVNQNVQCQKLGQLMNYDEEDTWEKDMNFPVCTIFGSKFIFPLFLWTHIKWGEWSASNFFCSTPVVIFSVSRLMRGWVTAILVWALWKKRKYIPLQAWTDPESSKRLSYQNFQTIG